MKAEPVAWLMQPNELSHRKLEASVGFNRPHDRTDWTITPLYAGIDQLNAEIERAHQKIIDLRNALKKLVYQANTFDGTGNTEAKLQIAIDNAKMMIAEGDLALQDDSDYTPNDNSIWAPRS